MSDQHDPDVVLMCEAGGCYNAATHAMIGAPGEIHVCAAHSLPLMTVSTAAVRASMGRFGPHRFDGSCCVCREDTSHRLVGSLLDEIDSLRRWKAEAIGVLGEWHELADEVRANLSHPDAHLGRAGVDIVRSALEALS